MPFILRAVNIANPSETTGWLANTVDTDMSEHWDPGIIPSEWKNVSVVRQVVSEVVYTEPDLVRAPELVNIQHATTFPTVSRVDASWNKV